MADNGGCALPCWWGFDLGEAPLEKVHQFYAAFNPYIVEQFGNDGISALYAQFQDPQIESGTQVRHVFVAQDGIVIEAEVEVDIQANYQVVPLLRQLGQPAEVWLWTIPMPREDALPASFHIYYPDRGVLILYATGGIRVEDTVNICFAGQGGTIILLWEPAIWNPNGDKGFFERTTESSELTLEGAHPIGEVSNWDVEHFYTVLSDPHHQECLETPAMLWPEP